MPNKRIDHIGEHRTVFEKNKKRILATQEICGICGHPVDKKLKVPDPMAPVIDHIIPISKGGHPSDINNLQLAHNICNRMKSNKIQREIRSTTMEEPRAISNRDLPLSCDWLHFGEDDE